MVVSTQPFYRGQDHIGPLYNAFFQPPACPKNQQVGMIPIQRNPRCLIRTAFRVSLGGWDDGSRSRSPVFSNIRHHIIQHVHHPGGEKSFLPRRVIFRPIPLQPMLHHAPDQLLLRLQRCDHIKRSHGKRSAYPRDVMHVQSGHR